MATKSELQRVFGVSPRVVEGSCGAEGLVWKLPGFTLEVNTVCCGKPFLWGWFLKTGKADLEAHVSFKTRAAAIKAMEKSMRALARALKEVT